MMTDKIGRQQSKHIMRKIIIGVILCWLMSRLGPFLLQGVMNNADNGFSNLFNHFSLTGSADIHYADATANDWNLILINKQNYIPEDYEVELTELDNGQRVDCRIYPQLQAMFDAARAAGLGLYVSSGYRTQDEQQWLLDNEIDDYCAKGYSRAEAAEIAATWVARPGSSEHEIGLAADISADNTFCEDEEVYRWLGENSWQYGFILRYPEDKAEVTGISYEPWHFRYVGCDAAREIYDREICLEEYLE